MKNFIDARIKELMALRATFTEAHAAALAEWNAMHAPAPAPEKKPKNGTGKKAPVDAPAKAELVEFKKANGETIMCTQAQADAWNASKDRLAKSEAEFEAYVPTPEHIAYMIAHPDGSAKEYREQGIKVHRGDPLKALKRKYIPDYKF